MLEDLFVFQPSPWEERNWRQLSGLPLEEVWLPMNDTDTVFAWFLDAGPSQPVMLWCHGNAGNISHRLGNMRELYHRGLSLLIFDYRGYGQSMGKTTEPGMYQDALASYDFLTQQRKIPPERIILFGRSLGSGVAGEVAIQRSSAGLIIEGAFPSIQAMADHHYLGLPARWFVDVEFALENKIPKLQVPLLMMHGEIDSVVPIELGQKVFETAPQPKRWYTVPGAGHNDVPYVGGEAYFQEIFSFVRKAIPGQVL